MRRCSTPHIHNSNLEDCFRLGRNYTLPVTETVRRSELLRPTFRGYPARDKNVKRNYNAICLSKRLCNFPVMRFGSSGRNRTRSGTL